MLVTNFYATLALGGGVLLLVDPARAAEILASDAAASAAAQQALPQLRLHGCTLLAASAAVASVGERRESLQCAGAGLLLAGAALAWAAWAAPGVDARVVLPLAGLNAVTGISLIRSADGAPSKF
jgi:hypothetical protein